jgi:flagellar biosynthesis/type III secretory pathway protein FliH
LYRRGFDRQQVIDLFRVIDWMMRLPKDLQAQLRQDLNTLEEESKMVYITSIEQLAKEEGMQAGMQQGMQQGRVVGKIQLLERQLQLRFGELPDWVHERLAQAEENELGHWTDAVLSAVSLESMFSDDRH